jgi:hypothetical protein
MATPGKVTQRKMIVIVITRTNYQALRYKLINFIHISFYTQEINYLFSRQNFTYFSKKTKYINTIEVSTS